jgi:hypothetical protein
MNRTTPYFRLFLVIMMLFLVGAYALAQPVAIPLQPCITDRPDLALPTPVKPIGVPAQMPGGSCDIATIEVNTVGGAVAYWCRRPAPLPPLLYLYAVRWDAVTTPMMIDWMKLGLPGDDPERIVAMQGKFQTANVMDMCDVWGPARERINAAMPLTLAAPTWAVAKNSTYLDRPAYAYVAGKRSYSSTARAKVGAPCDCAAISLVEATTQFCQVAPSLVSVCTPTQP